MNPELKRFYWIDFSWVKVAVSFVFILAFIVLKDQLPNFGYTRGSDSFLTVQILALLVYGLSRIAALLNADIKNQVWEQQKLSVVSAWSLSWAKIIGTCLTPWALSLALTVFYLLYFKNEAHLIAKDYLIIVLLALALHTLCICTKLLIRSSLLFTFIFVGLLIYIFSIRGAYSYLELKAQSAVNWWGMAFDPYWFAVASLALLLVLSLLLLWRVIRYELTIPSYPWMLLCLVFSLGLYISGFAYHQGAVFEKTSLNALYLSYLFFYSLLISERFSPAKWNRFINFYKKDQINRALMAAPLWLIGYGLLIVLTAISLLFTKNPLLLILFFLNGTRDLMIIMLFRFSSKSASNFFPAIVLCALYLLVPFYFATAKLDMSAMLYINPLYHMVIAHFQGAMNYSGAMISLCVQVAILGALAYFFWQERLRKLEAQ